MGLSKEKQYAKARAYGRAVAIRFVKFMQDPVHQGEAFSWERVPETCADLAGAACYTSFRHNIKKDVEEVAEQEARETARALIKEIVKSDV